MLGKQSKCFAKRRLMVFLYLTCFTISMTPTIVAPPEREFSHGQPELHQAMDNMVSHGISVKKTGNLPTIGASNYPAVTNVKTFSLFDEAEHVLSTLPNSRKKQWIQIFLQRMRAIERMLERTSEMSQHSRMDLVNGTPVPEILPPQPTWPDTSAVPKLNSIQNSSMTFFKIPVTSSELSKVLTENSNPSENQAVMKPATLLTKKEYEDDDLIQELESLHKEAIAKISVQKSEAILPILDVTSAATPISLKGFMAQPDDVEEKKAKLKEKLLKELSDYQHLGGDIPTGLISALAENNENKGSNYKKKAEVLDTVIGKSREKNWNDIDNEEHFSEIISENAKVEKNANLQGERFLYLKDNYTLHNPHLHLQSNLPTLSKSHNSLQSKNRSYQTNFENPQKLIDFHKNHQTPGSSNNRQSFASNALLHKMKPLQKSFDGQLTSSNIKDHLDLPLYRSYHYPQQWNKKNSAVDISTISSKNHQLNDEMKRQLRDGKIVILSDSVVPLNLETSRKAENTK